VDDPPDLPAQTSLVEPSDPAPLSADEGPRVSLDPEGARLRQQVALAATAIIVGIVAALSLPPPLGGTLTVAGLLFLALSIHRLGRLGSS
jgi:hypothetical protein